MSELALKIIAENKAAHERGEDATRIDIGNCGLMELPEELFECDWLEELLVSNEYWDDSESRLIESQNQGSKNIINVIPKDIDRLKNLRRLEIARSHNNVGSVIDIGPLAALANLKYLNLHYNRLTDIAPLAELKALTTLDLSYNQLSDISKLVELTGLTSLNLYNNRLTDISPLADLRALNTLDLSTNQIEVLEPLAALTCLRSLNLYNNQIKDIKQLSHLKALNILDLSGNELTDIEPLAALTDLRSLDLSGNKITDIEPLSALSDLSSLELGGSQLTDIKPVSALRNLTSLKMSGNPLKDISPLAGLKLLRSLELNGNQLTDIGHLAALHGLMSLDVVSNPIADIRPLAVLQSLTSLKLINNQLTEISPVAALRRLVSLEISDNPLLNIEPLMSLKGLDSLKLSGNHLTSIDPLATLTNLGSLNLYNNRLNDIRPLANLKALTILDLSDNRLSDIKPLAALTELTSLNLYNNELTDIRPLASLTRLTSLELGSNKLVNIGRLAALTGLKELNLSGNRLKLIKPLAGLSRLRSLELNRNHLTDIKPLAVLTTLTTLDLRYNRIKILPLELLEGINLQPSVEENDSGISLFGNPIESPPIDVIARGREFATEYLKNEDKKPLNEFKIILIGKGGVGKTTLQKRLMREQIDLNEPFTHGIRKVGWTGEIKSVQGDDIKVNIWDFGGQHIQQALHQFFYSRNTLYILVLDGRREDDPEGFLELVKAYGAGSPVIVVYNNRMTDTLTYNTIPCFDSTLRNKYPNIKKVFGLDCGRENDFGLESLRKYLQQFIPHEHHVRELYPKSWLGIKKELVELVEPVSTPYLLYNQYQAICDKHKLQEHDIQKGLAEMLAAAGTITYFDRPFDNHYYILNPDWLTTGAYRIILSDITRQKRGRITRADLASIFLEKEVFEYRGQDIKILLDLMAEFDLCHQFGHYEEWLIPSSLDGQSRYNLVLFRDAGARQYTVRYPLALPASVIHRFIVRNIRYAHGEDFWRNGIVVKHPSSDTLMFVEADANDNEIRLYIKGQMVVECWEFFRKDLRELSERFEYEELVILDTGESVTYQLLTDAKNDREEYVYIGGKTGRIDVRKTLGLFETERKDYSNVIERMDKRQNLLKFGQSGPLKVFISYAHADNEFGQVELFERELKSFLSADRFEIFKDGQIILGEKWHDRLQREVDTADVCILLLSSEFFQSNYIKDYELKKFIENNANRRNVLSPIYFDPFELSEHPDVSQFQLFKPAGRQFGNEYASIKDLSYTHFIKWHQDGRILPNPARKEYVGELARKIKEIFNPQSER